MGTLTYKAKLNGIEYQIKAKKAIAEKFTYRMGDVAKLASFCRETTDHGVSTFMVMFGTSDVPIRDPEDWTAKLAQLAQDLANASPITVEAMSAFLARAKEIFDAHVPEKDSRTTAEERAERNRLTAEREAKSRQDADDFLSEFSNGQQVDRNDSQMFLIAEVTFDNSDSMTDYFDRHSQIGSDLALAVLPTGRQTEAKVREIIARYPELAGLTWKWHDENYSMGRGYYLDSSGVPLPEKFHRTSYGGYEVEHFCYSVRFDKYAQSLPAFRGYPGAGPAVTNEAESAVAERAEGVTVKYDRDWTWIHFPSKPDSAVLEGLKGLGGRFSGKRQAWYFTRPIAPAELAPLGITA